MSSHRYVPLQTPDHPAYAYYTPEAPDDILVATRPLQQWDYDNIRDLEASIIDPDTGPIKLTVIEQPKPDDIFVIEVGELGK